MDAPQSAVQRAAWKVAVDSLWFGSGRARFGGSLLVARLPCALPPASQASHRAALGKHQARSACSLPARGPLSSASAVLR